MIFYIYFIYNLFLKLLNKTQPLHNSTPCHYLLFSVNPNNSQNLLPKNKNKNFRLTLSTLNSRPISFSWKSPHPYLLLSHSQRKKKKEKGKTLTLDTLNRLKVRPSLLLPLLAYPRGCGVAVLLCVANPSLFNSASLVCDDRRDPSQLR